jgi:ribonuclease G
MARARNRDAVMKTLRKALDEDRTKTFTAEISKLGLVEMTRQNVTEGVREIMSQPCPTCDGEGVIRSEETIALEFERRLREIAVENPDVEAFLVQINPRVSTQFTGHASRSLRALETKTGKFFHFEGSEGLNLDHFAITFQGSREEVEERALPFHEGDEVLVEIVEPHMYDVDDAVAKIDGYIISISGAAPHVGEKRMVRIEQVGRTAATALLLDENGQPITPTARQESSPGRRQRGRRSQTSTEVEKNGRSQGRRHRVPADSEDSQTRREAGLSDSPTSNDSEPEEDALKSVAVAGEASEAAETSPAVPSQDEGGEDDLQSKPRRRGRRGGRRRFIVKAPSSPE